jgi:hypothetical protein
MLMATTPEYISYDGNPTNPNGLTPFGIFDSEALFQTDGPKVANFVATRLGYPIMDVELQDLQIYTCLEESVIEYGKQVNQFRIRDNMYTLLGSSTDEDYTQKNIIATPLDQVVRLSAEYGTEALSGGNVELKRGHFTASIGTASYDLNALWATPSESGKPIELRKVYHQGTPSIARYYDPFAATGMGITNLFSEFGFDDYSPAITFVMMPAYEDMLRVQAIEINDVVRKSQYTFTVSKNKLRISPIPLSSYTVFFDYYVTNEKSGSAIQSGRSVTLATGTLSLTSGSAAMTVTDVGHGASVGDKVNIDGVVGSTIGGVAVSNFNKTHTITTAPTANTWTATLDANASIAATAWGGSVVATYGVGVNQFVSDVSNVPLSHLPYANINSVGKVWIYKYTLALAKELLGLIRSKYERVPIPNADIRMDGETLRREAVHEKEQLIKELQETLQASGRIEQMKAQAESAEHQAQILQKVPIPIYVM